MHSKQKMSMSFKMILTRWRSQLNKNRPLKVVIGNLTFGYSSERKQYQVSTWKNVQNKKQLFIYLIKKRLASVINLIIELKIICLKAFQIFLMNENTDTYTLYPVCTSLMTRSLSDMFPQDIFRHFRLQSTIVYRWPEIRARLPWSYVSI